MSGKRLLPLVFALVPLVGCLKPDRGANAERGGAGTTVAASRAGVPDWVPVYSGARVSDVNSRKAGIETYTEFRVETSRDCRTVAAWYESALTRAGFSVDKFTYGEDGCSGSLRAEGPGRVQSVRVSLGGNGQGSRFTVTAVERDLGPVATASAARIPEWIPQYPGASAEGAVTQAEGSERRTNFHFATSHDAQRVTGWYEQTLKAAGFTIVNSTVFDEGNAKMTAQDAAGRCILRIRMQRAGSSNVVTVEAMEGVR